MPLAFPIVPGIEGAGVVDEIGDGVTGFAVGDEVFGIGSGTNAQFAVLDHFAMKPAEWSWQQAAGVAVAAEAGARMLGILQLTTGQTLLVDNASGSVGAALAQFAIARGITVIGTAGEANHERLRTLGVIPVTYGPGMAERVASVWSGPVDAAVDAAGRGSVPELVAITGSASRVVSLADPGAPEHGVEFSTEASGYEGLDEAARLARRGEFVVAVGGEVHFNDAAAAHLRSERGHTAGKIVFG
jgi:NADPH:quinone reductase-like Zn-dependent oxidoreductase